MTGSRFVIVPGQIVRVALAHRRWHHVQQQISALHDGVKSGRSPPLREAAEQHAELSRLRLDACVLADFVDTEFRRWCRSQGARPEIPIPWKGPKT